MTLLSIGDFSRMTHLSVKALRHYHDIELLEPAAVDRFTGYRSYESDQVPLAQVIRRLRDLDMPLDQVKKVLDAPSVEDRNQTIVAHLTRMEAQLEHTQAMVASLRGLLEVPPAPQPVTYRSIPPTLALAVTEYVTAAEFGPWWVATFDRLYRAVQSAGLAPSGPSGSLYPGEFFEMEEGDVTAFVPIQHRPARDDHDASVLEVPGVEAAVMVHHGDYADLDRTYGLLGTVVVERAIGVEGPIREYYVVSPRETAEPDEYRTEVCWPVFATAVTEAAEG